VKKGLRINFNDYEQIYQSGFRLGEFDLLNDLTAQWLLKYPNDIQINIRKSEIDLVLNQSQQVDIRIKELLEKDPENLRAYEIYESNNQIIGKYYQSVIHALSGKIDSINDIYPWAIKLRAAKNEYKRKNFEKSERLIRSAISEDTSNILIALEHLRISYKRTSIQAVSQLADIYSQRWGKCIQFQIWKALCKMENAEETEAVSILHTCVHSDPGGVVIKRMFGDQCEFLSVWPKERFTQFSGQISSNIAVALDWTLLHSGENDKHAFHKNENWVKRRNVKLGGQKTASVPKRMKKVYVILSSYFGLKNKYGPKSADIIVEYINKLGDAVNERKSWESIVFIPDDANISTTLGLNPVGNIDPWKIKLSLMDLNKLLNGSGKMIGAVVIVGNNEIIPFHRLPNPTDDNDKEVLSDNPYATTSSNYLLPEWPIGRLPGEKGSDPGLLISQLRAVTEFHSSIKKEGNALIRLIANLKITLNIRNIFKNWLKKPRDFGYSAEVWQRSSLASFRPIGKGADLRICPPYDEETIDIENLMKAKCAYFNLHGLANTSEWYGQRDFSSVSDGPDFPVALSAKNISKFINNIDLVYTEACYGGNILDKKIDESIALQLISIKCQGIVGSTCISYGSVFTPLIGGDLLGFVFWKYIKDGYSFGASLMQAKIGLVKVMMQRQGFLDGEDQKTLLSFVLYGDPIGNLEPNIDLEKPFDEGYTNNEIHTFTDQDGIKVSASKVSSKLTEDITEMLQSYIPGLENAEIKVKKHKINIQKTLNAGSGRSGKINTNLEIKQLTQVLYKKSIFSEKRRHTQYARVTMDENGKILKLAVSR